MVIRINVYLRRSAPQCNTSLFLQLSSNSKFICIKFNTSKAYRCLDLLIHKIYPSRDVYFDETFNLIIENISQNVT